MQHYVQPVTCKKILAVAILLGSVVFLFLYTDNTLTSYYYDDGFLELVDISFNTSDTENQKISTVDNEDTPDDSSTSTVETDFSELQPSINSNSEDPLLLKPSSRNEDFYELKPSINTISEGPPILKPSPRNEDFLVCSPECKIPNFDPFNKQALKFFHKDQYISCSRNKLLTYINVTDNNALLYINKEVLPSYTRKPVECCYSYISRHGSPKNPDEGIKFSSCINFESPLQLTQSTVKVSCKIKWKKKIYENVHEAITVKKEFVTNATASFPTKLPSILFVGIDSISRLNLVRALPKTYHFLSSRNETWYPLYGYNKIGDNTFPNLMAIFTGYNETEAYAKCNPKKIGPLDACRFIWKDFKRFGYLTAYAEDETSINTFNYRKKGFIKEPVDYYYRPYMEAAESLGTLKQDTLSYCAGPETSGERIMNLAKNFAVSHLNYPTFGFFWMNTFSHNNLNTPSRMDEKVLNLLNDLTDLGVLNNSIVIFLSDHGIRFGEIRHTFTGWLEERLPFIFFSFPEWFKNQYTEQIANFRTNANRLTTPYDLHLTLQHIISLSGFNYSARVLETCPLCTSLFNYIGLNRSCETSGVTPHWCTCGGYSKLDQKDFKVLRAANFLIDEVEKIIHTKKEYYKCAKFKLGKILTSYISNKFSYKNDKYLLIAVETIPKAVFEATLNFKTGAKNSLKLSIDSSISRLDSYAQHGKCVNDERLKQYCFCK